MYFSIKNKASSRHPRQHTEGCGRSPVPGTKKYETSNSCFSTLNSDPEDVIVALCGFINKDQVLNHAVEFVGEGVATLAIEDVRLQWGSLKNSMDRKRGAIRRSV